ncbi:MAG: hypothetical protein EOP76_19920 [Variovorax sp.]|nr:MAG: hypothetical protein EOP76_19920 [Variovorax sp.]
MSFIREVLHTPSLRALSVAPPTPLQGATPADRQSRLRGVSRQSLSARFLSGRRHGRPGRCR